MNIGQVMDSTLVWQPVLLVSHIATPVFDGASSKTFGTLLKKQVWIDAKTILYDGRTGEPFDNRVSVGVMYMIKLHHMVDKSTRVQSDLTQPCYPTTAQVKLSLVDHVSRWKFGPEAYGASNVLQESLTYKSDDINGRLKACEPIQKETNSKTRCSRILRVLVKRIAIS